MCVCVFQLNNIKLLYDVTILLREIFFYGSDFSFSFFHSFNSLKGGKWCCLARGARIFFLGIDKLLCVVWQRRYGTLASSGYKGLNGSKKWIKFLYRFCMK